MPWAADRQSAAYVAETEAPFGSPHYALRSEAIGTTLPDTFPAQTGGFLLDHGDRGALLRTEYTSRTLETVDGDLGLFRYGRWLPIRRILPGSSSPATYRSRGLAKRLGIEQLYLTVSGYQPEIGVTMKSGTFKECEAFSVAARLPKEFDGTLVVASAGNTARAFYRVFTELSIPALVVIPEANLDRLWSDLPGSESVTVVAVGDGADYTDAIETAAQICKLPGYLPEGGAKNVARRDGMGTTMLSAAEEIGAIPDHYFQAVGSGTGAIAAWEANLRLIGDGRYGNHLAKLHLSQNAPFTLLRDSWARRARRLVELDEGRAKGHIGEIDAAVLANRRPPYSVGGGLFDALEATEGAMYAVTNGEAREAGELFLEEEGLDLAPAAKVATASLIQALSRGTIGKGDRIMLNVTGAGIERFRGEVRTATVRPDIIIGRNEVNGNRLKELLDSRR